MVIVFYNKLSETVGRVNLVHHQPHLLSESERAGGISLQEFPMPEVREGFYSLPYINLVTFEPYYEYLEVVLTQEQILQKENDELRAQLAALRV